MSSDSAVFPPRSRFKRLFKQAVAGLSPPALQPGVVILTYHKVGSPVPGEMNVPLPEFRRQMEYLAQHCTVLPLADAIRRAREGPLDRDLVVLTFDDGYRTLFTQAYSILWEQKLSATVYICPEFADKSCLMPWDRAESEAVMDWPMLRELTAGGLVTVGSHTWSHRVLPGAPDHELEIELARSRAVIEDRLGVAVPDFCYPKSLWDERTRAAVRRHYATAAVGGCRKNSQPPDPYCLYRIPVVLSDTYPLFQAKLAGRVRWESMHSGPRKLYWQLTGRWPVQ